MVKTVRLDKKHNYLLDTKTGNVLERYDPSNTENVELYITLENSMIMVKGSNIKTEYGGQVVVQYNDDKFIIDDGYQDILIKAGYIVYKDYDIEQIADRNAGITLRQDIIKEITSKLDSIGDKYKISNTVVCTNDLESEAKIYSKDHIYTIIVTSVDDMVIKNNRRKANSLSFYPFDKNMDRYGTVYISIFAQKKGKEKDGSEKYRIATNFIAELVSDLGLDYHYVDQIIKRRVINWNRV